MINNVKYLINWTHRDDCAGGVESRYNLIQKAFPNAELIAVNKLTNLNNIIDKRRVIDKFISENTKNGDIIIKDAGVGGTIAHKSIKQILLFGNPYYSLAKRFNKFTGVFYWNELIKAQKQDSKYSNINLANSLFSKIDAEKSGCCIDGILYNSVDTDFWRPKVCEKKYILWVGSHFKKAHSEYDLKLFSKKLKIRFVRIFKEDNLSKTEMKNMYQKAFCLVHDFPIEGNSNVILEALSCDIPILTTRTGLFFEKEIKQVGRFLPNKYKDYAWYNIKEVLNKIDSFRPRQFIIDNNFTYCEYINKIRNIVKGLDNDYF